MKGKATLETVSQKHPANDSIQPFVASEPAAPCLGFPSLQQSPGLSSLAPLFQVTQISEPWKRGKPGHMTAMMSSMPPSPGRITVSAAAPIYLDRTSTRPSTGPAAKRPTTWTRHTSASPQALMALIRTSRSIMSSGNASRCEENSNVIRLTRTVYLSYQADI